MFFFPRLKKKSISCRQCLYHPYKTRYFIKKKWRKLFESEILIIDEKFNNYKDFKKFRILPFVRILIIRNIKDPHIPELPNCWELYLKNVELTKLPKALPKCRILDVSYNQIRVLPQLPSCQILHVNHNNISYIEALPKCRIIHCEYNHLEEIQSLPNCKKLYANNNQLYTLPLTLPKCVALNVDCNQLTRIPFYPKCQQLHICHNPIERILVNNHVDISFFGKQKLYIFRFSHIISAVVQLIEQYNMQFEKNTRVYSPYKDTKNSISVMRPKRKTLFFAKQLIQKLCHNVKVKQIDAHHIESIKFFLNYKF